MADTWQLQRYIVVCMGTCGLILGWLWNKKRNRNETKRNETQQKLKKTKHLLTKRFFYMRQQSTKCQWRIEKALKFLGNFGKFCAATSPPMYLVFFSDFQNVWIRYWKRKKYLHFRTRFCRLRFVIRFFFKSWIPQIYQTVEMDEDEEGAYIFMLQKWVRT